MPPDASPFTIAPVPGPVVIRPAVTADVAAIAGIEVAAGALFRTVGMDAVADEPPSPAEVIAGYVEAGRSWVAADDRGPVGFLLADVVDGAAHIEQVSVHPDRSRAGIGRQLIDTAADWARAQGMTAMTLTTFADVAWNGPYYTRLGFEAIPDADLPPRLRRIREDEAGRGLDRWSRVAMRRRLDPLPPP